MKKIIYGLVLLFVMQAVAADVLITEVMHSPTETLSDTDGEWVELYNSGSESVDLADYKLDGYNFDDAVIESGEYIVVARELMDGDDEDNESFECAFGNCNGLWDEAYTGLDGYFSLSAEDTVVLSTAEGVIDEVTYNSSEKCLERVSMFSWEESVGTPGEGYFSVENGSSEGLEVFVNVRNSLPEILGVTFLEDDSSEEGIQVLPNVESSKEVSVQVEVTDVNDDLQNVSVSVLGREYNLSLNGTGSFYMNYYDSSGMYDLNVTACDYSGCVSSLVEFEYLGMIVTSLNTSSLSFDLAVGEEQEQVIEVVNSGNVVVDFDVTGTDLVSSESLIGMDNFAVFDSEWKYLSESVFLDLNLEGGSSEQLRVKFTVPAGVREGEYTGGISIVGREDETL